MNPTQIVNTLNNWNAKQEMRQKLMTDTNREALKSIIRKAHEASLDTCDIWNMGLMFKK